MRPIHPKDKCTMATFCQPQAFSIPLQDVYEVGTDPKDWILYVWIAPLFSKWYKTLS